MDWCSTRLIHSNGDTNNRGRKTMSKRMDFWEWLDICPVDYQLDNDDGMDMTLTFFFEDDEELEIVFEPEEDTKLDFNTAIKLVVDNEE